jgi:YVTN family beta-propeller protein
LSTADGTTARSGQLELEAGADQHTQTGAATEKQSSHSIQYKTNKWTAPFQWSEPMRRWHEKLIRRRAEGQDAAKTQADGNIPLLDRLGLSRHQTGRAAVAALLVIPLIVGLVVIITQSMATIPSVTATIPVGTDPRGVAVAPDGRHVYVTNVGSKNMSVIDATSNSVTATIPAGYYPQEVAVAPDGRHVYVTKDYSDVSVIDTVSNSVTATIPVGSQALGVAVAPDGRHAYVTKNYSDTVSVIDTTSNSVTATISTTDPRGVAVAPDGRHAYVTNYGSHDVSVIDTVSNSVTATIPAGTNPWGVAVTPDGRHAYVTNSGSNTISMIEVGARW